MPTTRRARGKSKCVTIADVLAGDDINGLINDLSREKASYRGVLVLAVRRDGSAVILSANMGKGDAIVLMDVCKLALVDDVLGDMGVTTDDEAG